MLGYLTYKVSYTLSEAHHSEGHSLMDKDSRKMASFGFADYLPLFPSLSLSSRPFRCHSCTTWCRSGTAWPPLYHRWCNGWWLSRSCMSKVLLQDQLLATPRHVTRATSECSSPSCIGGVRSKICQQWH